MTRPLVLACLLASSAAGADYAIASDGTSSVRLEVDKTGVLSGKTHVFTFARFQGNVIYHEPSIADSSVQFTIDAPSIRCNDTWLSAKDLAKVQQYAERDMLAVDRYKHLSFRSISVVALEPNVLKVLGTLTIRDVTRPVEVRVRLTAAADTSLTAEGMSSIKLTDFKLSPPSAALGLIGTKDDMRLIVRLKLVRVVVSQRPFEVGVVR
jgi:polyisoprenoid-binding protein YceI